MTVIKKLLFIDRDGTIIVEPPTDFQVDSLEKLAFLPRAITALNRITKQTSFELVMVTNQDGLGTESFPEDTFWPAHNKMLDTLTGENIRFAAQHIDKSFEHQNLPTRKPGTALLKKYINNPDYDLSGSYVIGDRLSDIKLAQNLGCKGIFIGKNPNEEELAAAKVKSDTLALVTKNWHEIADFLQMPPRRTTVHRQTKETDITVELNLDGEGKADMQTGLGFFDHMLEQIARHSGANIAIKVAGDLHIDEHHTVEDTALTLGEAWLKALGNKKGIERYGFLLPMDEALAQVALDFSGRSWLVWDAEFKREKVGDLPTEMFDHFFKSFADSAKCNINIKSEGKNEHHKIESVFKAFAKCLGMASRRNPDALDRLPSTKEML